LSRSFREFYRFYSPRSRSRGTMMFIHRLNVEAQHGICTMPEATVTSWKNGLKPTTNREITCLAPQSGQFVNAPARPFAQQSTMGCTPHVLTQGPVVVNSVTWPMSTCLASALARRTKGPSKRNIAEKTENWNGMPFHGKHPQSYSDCESNTISGRRSVHRPCASPKHQVGRIYSRPACYRG